MMQLLIELTEENNMSKNAMFTEKELTEAMVAFMENPDVEMIEFKSDKNPGVTYKVTMSDGTEISNENAWQKIGVFV